MRRGRERELLPTLAAPVSAFMARVTIEKERELKKLESLDIRTRFLVASSNADAAVKLRW